MAVGSAEGMVGWKSGQGAKTSSVSVRGWEKHSPGLGQVAWIVL